MVLVLYHHHHSLLPPGRVLISKLNLELELEGKEWVLKELWEEEHLVMSDLGPALPLGEVGGLDRNRPHPRRIPGQEGVWLIVSKGQLRPMKIP